ncbi:MAG: hypothetical protein E4H03_03295 [Myxococcales bacterium]|jgi:hypothetical protein|nr:MAG: hypothetical protein E4H03_03295 [Myxococcales bacterium]
MRLEIAYAIDAHAHADHMTDLPCFRDSYGARTVTGKKIRVVQKAFGDFYNLGDAVRADGSQFDVLLGEGDALEFGGLALDGQTSEAEFMAFRERRDAELAAPALILASVQADIRAGALPEPESDGTSYLKIPLDRLGRRKAG